MASFTAENMPDLRGSVALVTGANSGLGLETARALAGKGASIILGCRSSARADEACRAIRSAFPQAALDVELMDLGDLESIERAAASIRSRHASLDLLCNNAGVMAIPRRLTASGFETQIGTNHLGHFALTGHLLDLLLRAPAPRVVTVSSLMHQYGRIDFDDLHGERRYDKWRAYQQSKLANLLFIFELARRALSTAPNLISAGAHPGYASTNLQYVGPLLSGSKLMHGLSSLGNYFIGQSAAMGALPTLYALTAPDVRSGDYYGPRGFRQLRGYPRKVGTHPRARSEPDARRLWDLSVELTGVDFKRLEAVQETNP
jgi:NAD(P)-dependent dehydrogenase (short-subunit alcohol dehydrogenase family)